MDEVKRDAFSCHRMNTFAIQFPNGNRVSTIWGQGTYTENRDAPYNTTYSKDCANRENEWKTPMQAQTAEVMVQCSPRLLKRLERKYKASQPFGWVSLDDWLYIVNAVARDAKGKQEQ